ncbi:malto-oligosyltrehalose synthase [Agrobacterium rosae]|uniref:malto-oligosyltrehalose synthase n=1 Tax=Agrobacterium rosae TaxID=1972867 RepID=UPI0019D36EE7|nr:malto-oligosyltrehalose synthase [Agrobacterium rosae]MBN7804315.1 malto-oligosyltrehalose synthase [Agrobacterium rosae]
MTIPTATYRIQFRNGMTLDRAAEITPYLKKLGISHLYASPIFTATSGSTHGYDVTYANEIDPAIGGREGFDRLSQALKGEGLGLILDIVPNHMAASLENPWWRDVIEHGAESRYAHHFDIDWSRRLTLPFLGADFADALEADEIQIKADPTTGKPALCYHDAHYPLNPASYAGRNAELLETTDKRRIADLHDQQPYRLTCWRDASHDLSYRRFFEVTGLAGVKVENPKIFDDTHRLTLELVRSGAVDGLRVDHVDGLADPKAYLERLRLEAGPDCYITVEKILGAGESLPADWPVSGTTGYEFIAALSNVFVDNDKLGQLQTAYEAVSGQPVHMPAQLRDAKLLMVDKNFAGEFATLVAQAKNILNTETEKPRPSEEAIRAALRELVVSFPVYRTYGTQDGLPQESDAVLAEVVNTINSSSHVPDTDALHSLQRILRSEEGQAAYEFRTRFQQLTGPLMAKSVEDTLFYRQNMALALNEVGAEPLPHPYSVERFHAEMTERRDKQPDALSATSTHDTKRGEDARARLYALTEAPELWAGAVKRWQAMNAGLKQALDDGPAPEPAVEWMLYQALAGAWPSDLETTDERALKSLEDRFAAYVEKALREAKLRTNWGDSNDVYEEAVVGYARKLLSPENEAFLKDFSETLVPFIKAGLSNSLAQTLIKLTAPGVPDIYQGSEGLDLSLVDPDNRRESDFEAFEAQLAAIDNSDKSDEWEASGEAKQRLIATVLHMRRELPELFSKGRYLPLEVTGDDANRVVAYARTTAEDALIVIAPRLSTQDNGNLASLKAKISLPQELSKRGYIDVMTQTKLELGDTLDVERSFALLRSS